MNKIATEKIKALSEECHSILKELSLVEISIPQKNDLDTSALWTKYHQILEKIIKTREKHKIIYKPQTVYGLKIKNTEDIKYIGKTNLPIELRKKQHLNEKINPLKAYWVNENYEDIEIVPMVTNIYLDAEACYKEKFQISQHIKKGSSLLNYSDSGFFKIYENKLSIQKYPNGYKMYKSATKEDYVKVGAFLHYRNKFLALKEIENKSNEIPTESSLLWIVLDTIQNEIGNSENYEIMFIENN